MDQRVILAVAGSGKTSHIVNSIDPSKSTLVLTFTENNHKNLRNRIVRQFDGIPERTRVCTYFSFLYKFCLRPLCGNVYGLRGINLDPPPKRTRSYKRDNVNHYIDSSGRIYVSRISAFLIKFDLIDEVRQRVSKYFDCIFVDEVQDFAGFDFNFLFEMSANNIDSVFVGDFFQHTYDTSRDGNVNKSLHDDIDEYKKKFERKGFEIDDALLGKSYRCSPTTCEFVSLNLGIEIRSHQKDKTLLKFVDDAALAEAIFHKEHVVKLFYQSHRRYPCYSNNWGASKGIDDYDSVCVALNKNSEKLFNTGRLCELPPTTRNKLYVACTRARSELFFVPERLFHKFKRQ